MDGNSDGVQMFKLNDDGTWSLGEAPPWTYKIGNPTPLQEWLALPQGMKDVLLEGKLAQFEMELARTMRRSRGRRRPFP